MAPEGIVEEPEPDPVVGDLAGLACKVDPKSRTEQVISKKVMAVQIPSNYDFLTWEGVQSQMVHAGHNEKYVVREQISPDGRYVVQQIFNPRNGQHEIVQRQINR